jgi:hypothetical protein
MERQAELGHPGAPPALLESIPMIRNLAPTAVQASTAATKLRHVQSAALESTAATQLRHVQAAALESPLLKGRHPAQSVPKESTKVAQA